MKARNLVVLFSLLLAPMTALAKDAGARAAIEAANKVWMAAVEKGDAAAVAAAYSADAKLMPPNGDFVSGQKDIQAFFGVLTKAGIVKISLETVEVFDGADTATEIGKFTVSDAKGKVLDNGKYIVLWKKDGGKWKLHRDTWNSSAAPAPAAPPTK